MASSPFTPVPLDRALDLLPQGGDEQYICVTFGERVSRQPGRGRSGASRARDPRDDLRLHAIIDATSTFSWFGDPAGLYRPRDVELVHAAGYRGGVTTDPGVNDASTDRGRLRRTLVYSGDGATVFAAKLDGRLDKPPALRAWLYQHRAAA